MPRIFILELPLRTTPHDSKILEKRLGIGSQIYNACLAWLFQQHNLLVQTSAYQEALSASAPKKKAALLRVLEREFQVTDHGVQRFALEARTKSWAGDCVDAFTSQAIAHKAYLAFREWWFGKKGRPRFKKIGRFRSLERKNNKQGIRYRGGLVCWNGLSLKCRFDPKDKDGVQAHALSSRIRYVRLVKRPVKGTVRWYAQLILEGKSLIKAKHTLARSKVVGLDTGPSTIAAVGQDTAVLTPFCPDLPTQKEETKKLKRSIDRKRKANNPLKYNQNGTPIKGAKGKWVVSKKQRELEAELAEQERKLQANRKTQHGTLVNQVLSIGTEIKVEKLSYVGLQKLFGKSVGVRAPGMFMSTLSRKAENAGGKVVEFPAYKFKLSQLCHNCGEAKKKQLNERWHECSCGIRAQRDLYSAYLSRYVEGDSFDRSQAIKDWPGAEPLLEQALSKCNQTTIGRFRPASLGLNPSQSGSPVKGGSIGTEVGDVVRLA